MSVEEVLDRFIDCIPDIGISFAVKNKMNSDREWTRRILGYFRQEGERLGFEVRPNP